MKTIDILYALHDEGSHTESVVIGTSHSWTPESLSAALRSFEGYSPSVEYFNRLDEDSQKKAIDYLLSCEYHEFCYELQLSIVTFPIY